MVSESQERDIDAIDSEINSCVDSIDEELGDEKACFPILLYNESITPSVVDDVYDQLQERFGFGPLDKELVVILESGGGDIDAAYNLAHLLRQYGEKGFKFVIPRWAKSAATLLACSGDEILMTPVAELGPLDPQITEMNALEGRIEQFSPLHIESTLELIREEYKNGNKELADGLMQRLQYPLTLGNFKKSLELSKQYLEKLLTSGMLKDNAQKAQDASIRLTEGYADHGFCINIEEAKSIGLTVSNVPVDYLPDVWRIRTLINERRKLEEARRQEEVMERIRSLPPDLLEQLSPELTQDRPSDSQKR